MKKLFFALILCTALLCGCSPNGGEEISAVSETSSVAAAEESVTQTETTAAAEKETAVTTATEAVRSQDYDIGGGYVCFTTGEAENKILNVAKDNVITDSIKTGVFKPDWQIKFYDIDTPPCFALATGDYTLNYRTYFVIDGKITEMNWTLDGERLDTVDYTMLKCRGEGGGFVSYSVPVGDDDPFERRRFTFADGDYTNIVGYTEQLDDKIMKWWDAEHFPKNLDRGENIAVAYEIISKFCCFWDDTYSAKGSYTDEECWLWKIEKEGFRTREEMLDTLSEFCTTTVAEDFYSMLIEGEYSDFKVIDGRICRYDGPPYNYLPYYYIESAEERDGVITARLFAHYDGQEIPYIICPPLYAEFVREDGVWKINKLPYEKNL